MVLFLSSFILKEIITENEENSCCVSVRHHHQYPVSIFGLTMLLVFVLGQDEKRDKRKDDNDNVLNKGGQ